MPDYGLTPLLHDAPTVRVYVRPDWSSAWTLEPFLRCDAFEVTANPTISHAQLYWRYGEILHPGEQVFAEFPDRTGEHSLQGYYVKIVVSASAAPGATVLKRWYGVIDDSVNAPDGWPQALTTTGQIPSGRQALIAFGLEFLLERQFITHSWCLEGGVKKRVERGIPFNEENKHRPDGRRGNRSASLGPDGCYLFSTDLDTAQPWSTLEIIKYLIKYHSPAKANGDPVVPWTFTGNQFVYLYDRPAIAQHNRPVKAILDQLLDRRRILGYTVEPAETVTGDETASTITSVNVRAFAFNSSTLSFGGDLILGNPDATSVSLGDSPDAKFKIKETSADRYEQVEVRGARLVGCFTLSGLDGTLSKGWSSAEELAYEAAASGATDYGSLDKWEKQMRNDLARHDLQHTRVFRYFGIAPTWDGKVRNGEASAPFTPWLPIEGDPTTPRFAYRPGTRFERLLPLKTNHDYTGSNIASNSVANNTPAGETPEFLPMIVLVTMPNYDETYTGEKRYVHLDSVGAASENEFGSSWCASSRAQEDAPGIVVDVQAFAMQHLIALEDFDPLPVDLPIDELRRAYGGIDWHDNLICTVAMMADDQAIGKWPTSPLAGDNFFRRLVIDAGEQYQAHYVAPGTVVGISDGKLLRSTSGGWLRDDRPALQNIARFAFEWYDQLRRSLELRFTRSVFDFAIGQLITTIDGRTIGSCVTRQRWEFPETIGERPQAPVNEIETAFASLDIQAFIGGGGP